MPITVGDIVEALSALGGEAHLAQITEAVRKIATPPLPPSTENVIRGRLQEHSSDAQSFKGKRDLFRSVHGVAARRGIWALREDELQPKNLDAMYDDAEPSAFEGALKLRQHLRRERSKKLVSDFKAQLEDFRCSVCKFDFEAKYGKIGAGFIEAHHIIPVAMIEPGVATKLSDLVAVCSNCHRMLHRDGLITWVELQSLLQTSTSDP
ncbi:HNH endonuclease [Sphingomonas astaxanthinifaciens]|uniref:HNH endonuclease n=1 Tax=Sphingomonas astaxanthinifaciens TaxID=407019 RepID=UPI0012EBF6EB|nr:HNH endonuclease [Sphingomonas astaxanthinifaciens]